MSGEVDGSLPPDAPALYPVWDAFAEQFLDTERRQDLPRAARLAVDAGLSVSEAEQIWRFEIIPAVGFNLMQVAGEWALWNKDWLIATVARAQRNMLLRPRWFSRLLSRLQGGVMEHHWTAIARCMERLMQLSEPERERLERDLSWLAHHYFDFLPKPRPVGAPELRSLVIDFFLPTFEPLVAGRERVEVLRQRLDAALSGQASG